MSGTRRRSIALGVLLAAAVAGCGGGEAATAPAKGAAVSIDTFAFAPNPLRVKAGTTVTWTNQDSILHTVSSGTRTYDPANSGLVTDTRKDGRFDVKLDGRSSTATHTFSEPGTYHYFCDLHPGMEADVQVN